MIPDPSAEPQAAVTAFVGRIADPAKRADTEALIAIAQRVTGQPPVMWGASIIGFGTTHYRYESGREGDTPLVSFSPRPRAITLYLGGGTLDTYREYLDRLGRHRTGAGCLYITRLSDIDLDVLTDLLAETVASQSPGSG